MRIVIQYDPVNGQIGLSHPESASLTLDMLAKAIAAVAGEKVKAMEKDGGKIVVPKLSVVP